MLALAGVWLAGWLAGGVCHTGLFLVWRPEAASGGGAPPHPRPYNLAYLTTSGESSYE